jgi:prefoldin subunit 5
MEEKMSDVVANKLILADREQEIKEYEDEIKNVEKQIEKLEKEYEGLKNKVAPLLNHYKSVASRVLPWLDEKNLDNEKGITGIIVTLQDVKEQAEDIIKIMDEIDDLKGEHGTIQRHHGEIESLQEDLKDLRTQKTSTYIKEKGQGTPGKPGYKPPLWYWITPSGKKKLIDQKDF